MRRYFPIFLTLAVLGAFSEEPFLHTHQHAATEGHPAPFLHLHLLSARSLSGPPAFRGLDPNEDAQYQSWNSAAPTESGSISLTVPTERFLFPIPEGGEWAVEAPLPIGHDPPLALPDSPRAPPA